MSSVARFRVAAILVLWWVVVVTASAGQPKDPKLALDQAISQGLVRAEFRGVGASTGDSIMVKVTNLTTRPLALEITPGTLLRSQAADVQDMVVERVRGIPTGGGMFRPVSEISLAAKASAEYILLAYCFNFDRANPGPQAQFSVGEAPSPEVRRLFEALPNAPAELRTIRAVQAALWVISGDVRKEELQERFPADETDISAARQLLERAGIETKTKRLFQ